MTNVQLTYFPMLWKTCYYNPLDFHNFPKCQTFWINSKMSNPLDIYSRTYEALWKMSI